MGGENVGHLGMISPLGLETTCLRIDLSKSEISWWVHGFGENEHAFAPKFI